MERACPLFTPAGTPSALFCSVVRRRIPAIFKRVKILRKPCMISHVTAHAGFRPIDFCWIKRGNPILYNYYKNSNNKMVASSSLYTYINKYMCIKTAHVYLNLVFSCFFASTKRHYLSSRIFCFFFFFWRTRENNWFTMNIFGCSSAITSFTRVGETYYIYHHLYMYQKVQSGQRTWFIKVRQ